MRHMSSCEAQQSAQDAQAKVKALWTMQQVKDFTWLVNISHELCGNLENYDIYDYKITIRYYKDL